MGVWAVRGNWEHWRPSDEEAQAYRSGGVRLLNNGSEQLVEDIWLVGIDDALAGKPDVLGALRSVPSNAFKIALIHSPSLFDRSSERFDLVLAGHTHGGQLRLPLLPPLWLPDGAGRFVSGWYGKGGSRMYVSRGLGNSIVDARFFCRPELTFLDLGY